jgi:hypothetical protein
MSRDPTGHLIDRLATDLAPVRPITALPVSLAQVLGAAAAFAAVVLVVYEPKAALWASFVGDPIYASVLAGLALAVVAACLAALASVIPGRETVQRAAVAATGVGLVVAVGVAALHTPWAQVSLGEELGTRFMCILRGAGFAIVPGLAVLYAATRGWSGSPARTAFLGLLGAGSLGALLVHLTCPASEPFHVLCTHSATPLLIALSLTLAVAPTVRRLAR